MTLVIWVSFPSKCICMLTEELLNASTSLQTSFLILNQLMVFPRKSSYRFVPQIPGKPWLPIHMGIYTFKSMALQS